MDDVSTMHHNMRSLITWLPRIKYRMLVVAFVYLAGCGGSPNEAAQICARILGGETDAANHTDKYAVAGDHQKQCAEGLMELKRSSPERYQKFAACVLKAASDEDSRKCG